MVARGPSRSYVMAMLLLSMAMNPALGEHQPLEQQCTLDEHRAIEYSREVCPSTAALRRCSRRLQALSSEGGVRAARAARPRDRTTHADLVDGVAAAG